MPMRTWSPFTSSTVTTMSLPIMMLSFPRRVRTSTAPTYRPGPELADQRATGVVLVRSEHGLGGLVRVAVAHARAAPVAGGLGHRRPHGHDPEHDATLRLWPVAPLPLSS